MSHSLVVSLLREVPAARGLEEMEQDGTAQPQADAPPNGPASGEDDFAIGMTATVFVLAQ